MKIKYLIFLILLCVIPIISLFHSGLPITHDGQDHVARIANFYQNLKEGVIIPRWAGNLNWGYGHPILEFLYPLPSYIASLFHFIGFSLVDSTKIVFGLSMVSSLIFMYLWLSSFLSRNSAILGAVLYAYAPYRFVDLYVRGDIGENLAFAFIPLVLLFIYRISKEKNFNNVLFGGISLAFLILSHNAVSLIFIPFILFYTLFLIAKDKNRKRKLIYYYTIILVLGFALSAFFWIPGLFEAKYTLRNIVTKGAYLERFVNLKDLIYGSWKYDITGQFTVQVGIINWLSLIVSPIVGFYLYKKTNKDYILILGLIIYTLIAIFLMLPVSNFIWSRIMLLQNFQFPWRFLAITIFTTAVLGAFFVSLIPQKFQIWFSLVLIALILILSKDYIKPKGYLYKPESFYTGIYKGTTDTGESAPIWSVRFMEKEPKAHLEVVDGEAKITEIKRTSIYHEYKIAARKKTMFLENTLYFPGWQIIANNNPVQIEFQNPQYRGLMTFVLGKGNYKLAVLYKETKVRAFADAISIVVFLNILGLFTFKFVKVKF